MCALCPKLEHCTKLKNHQKVVTPYNWKKHKKKVRLYKLSKSGKSLYKYRKVNFEFRIIFIPTNPSNTLFLFTS
ncbi:hypothetical protein COC46_14700 [Bacillus sp. AFS041924]|nr:hypothetical protein COC46_14700 [Bacillus sp. AFS041924]